MPQRHRIGPAATQLCAVAIGASLLGACNGSQTGAAGAGGAQGSGGAGGAAGTTGSGGATGAGGAAGSTETGAGGATGDAGSSGTGGVTGSGGSGGGGATAGTGGAGGTTACAPPTIPLPAGNDATFATLVQFNDNGAWSWYQDERAVVDTKANKLIVGSVASGGARNGNVEAAIYNLATNAVTRTTLPSTLPTSAVDDHNAAAFAIRPDGKYVAMWSGHRVDCLSRTSIFDGTAWGAENKIDWTPLGCPWAGAATNMITYSNVWYMGSSLYSGIRSVNTDPAFLASTDDGQSWSYYGRLTSSPQVGYVAGYYKYWGDNVGRIDFLGTEAHPRDFDNSLYHGYVQGGKVYDSLGNALDSSFKDTSTTTTNAVNINTFTPVFKTGATIHGVVLNHAWNYDVVRYADGTVAGLWQARVNGTGTTDPDKRALYARFDGTKWSLTYLGKMGAKLYASEEDYTGLGALVPDDPHTIYLSTTIDPRDDTTNLGKHEIFQGTTCDNGATFTWTPLTARSTMDNLRPIVPKWDASHTALVWMRGTYTSAQSYVMKVVGVVTTKP